VDHEILVARLCELAGEAGRQLAADTDCIAELRAELDSALEDLERVRSERDRALARCRRLEAVRAA
jgi:hypothetical protein